MNNEQKADLLPPASLEQNGMLGAFRKKLLVSFSGGETSAYMAQWLWNNKQDEYEMIFVFANTGEENEETLMFVKNCEALFGFKVIWIEAKVFFGERKSTGFKIIDYFKASREGQPFEDVIKKYGIPNQASPHCTRELKENPIKAYARSVGWADYYTAIGIREDEFDRMNAKRKEMNLIYPLISMRPMTKPKINFWWSQQPFRLNLKGYQGNCKTCWKKSDSKLFQIAKESPEKFLFMGTMEAKYGMHIPESKMKVLLERGKELKLPLTFFRGNRSATDILNQSKNFTKKIIDDSQNFQRQSSLFDVKEEDVDLVGGESCEVFSSCA